MPDKIKKIQATEIFDSRGDPTLAVTVELSNGLKGSAKVPSGASTGRFEAQELRDNDPNRYHGKGVLRAIKNVNQILNNELTNLRVTEQQDIDLLMIELDGTRNKRNLGANAILGVSLAVAQTAAKSIGQPLYKYLRQLYDPTLRGYSLPTPLANVINGGKHADNNIDLQEFWLVPTTAPTFVQKFQQLTKVYQALGRLLFSLGYGNKIGDEGGYAPQVKAYQEIFDFLIEAIITAGYQPGQDILLGVDAGASVFYNFDDQLYHLNLAKQNFTSEELIDYYLDLVENYPLRFLEDPLMEEDWPTWQKITKDDFIQKHKIKIIGDDLFVTNVQRLQKGIDLQAANTILIKPNQVGTLTETLQAIRLAKSNNYQIVISHRSGETMDTTIADLAVAVQAEYIKIGATARPERMAKYNRLLNIEKELN